MTKSYPGVLLTLEGGEGAGKSTQLRALRDRLEAAGHKVTITREPGGTNLGEDVRRLLRRPGISRKVFQAITESDAWSGMDPFSELFLFEAARAQLARDVIQPALHAKSVVISDRFTDSTLAYQGYGRRIDVDTIRTINRLASHGITPNLTVLLDVPVEIGLARNRGEEENWRGSIGEETVEFLERVRAGFLTLATEEPDRWLVLDATNAPDVLTEQIWQRLEPLLRL